MAQDGIAYGAHEAVSQLASPRWLISYKEACERMRRRGERPAGKASGRWLGDYLDQDTQSGLLPAEEKLLFASMNGEACRLENRATRLWGVFEAWRDKVPDMASPQEENFAKAMAAFLKDAPEAVQEVMRAATAHAHTKLGTGCDWEPETEEDTHRFAAAQQSYFTKLKIEASPTFAATVRKSQRFFPFCCQVVIEALSPGRTKPAAPDGGQGTPMSRNAPLNVYAATRKRIDAQPRPLRGFFGELARHVQAASETDPSLISRLRSSPGLLRPHFDAVLTPYLREAWRWVDGSDPQTCIRAGFIRFLCLGGDEMAPVHERGLELSGASVTGDLDLTGCIISTPLLFPGCDFEGHIGLGLASIRSVGLNGSRVRSLDAPFLSSRGSLLLTDGFRAKEVFLHQAAIEGSLLMSGARVVADSGAALDCTQAKVGGDAVLGGEFRADGPVLFDGAKIGGSLSCASGAFRALGEKGPAVALSGRNAAVEGDVLLSRGFYSKGAARFGGVKIGGRLDCDGGRFENRTEDGTGRALDFEKSTIGRDVSLNASFLAKGEANFSKALVQGAFVCDGMIANAASSPAEDRAPIALTLEDARIAGPLVLGRTWPEMEGHPPLAGSLVLSGCHTAELAISPRYLPTPEMNLADGKDLRFYVHLDGLTYSRVTLGEKPAAIAKALLRRQPPRDPRTAFRPQPFDQLIEAYRGMGQTTLARQLEKYKARCRYRSRFIALWQGLFKEPQSARRLLGRTWLTVALDWLDWAPAIVLRATTGVLASIALAAEWAAVAFGTAYWHGWGRLAAFLVALWAGGGLFYLMAGSQDAFVPAHPAFALNKELQEKCRISWPDCKKEIPELSDFKPFTYSAEVMLPVLNTGQRRDWRPFEQAGKPLEIRLPVLHWLPDEQIVEIGDRLAAFPEGSLQRFMTLQSILSVTALGLLMATLFRRR